MKVLKVLFLISLSMMFVNCGNTKSGTSTTGAYYTATGYTYTNGYCYSTTTGQVVATTYCTGTTTTTTSGTCVGNYYYCPYGISYGLSYCTEGYCSGTNCKGYTMYTTAGAAVTCQ